MERLDSARVPEDPEKLNEEILQAREHRRRVEAEFDAFTNSFQRRQAQTAAPIVPTRREPDAVPDVPQAIVRPRQAPRRDRRVVIVAGVGIALAVALGAAMFATRGREQAPEVVRPDAAAAAPAAPDTAAARPPAA